MSAPKILRDGALVVAGGLLGYGLAAALLTAPPLWKSNVPGSPEHAPWLGHREEGWLRARVPLGQAGHSVSPAAASIQGQTSARPLLSEDPPLRLADTTGHEASPASAPAPWRLDDALAKDVEERLLRLRVALQASEKQRAEYSSKDTKDTSTIHVLIRAPDADSRNHFWKMVQAEGQELAPEPRAFYEVHARALLNAYLGLPARYRMLYVISHIDPEGPGGQQTMKYVFDTDSLVGFGIQSDAAVLTPPSLQPFTHMSPWFEPDTYQPSLRYGHLLTVEP